MEKSNLIHLSTACVSLTTASALNESAFTDTKLASELVVYMKSLYGWFIHVPENIENLDISDDLKECLKYAKANDCEWLAFDRDVEYDPSDGLKQFEW